MSGIRPRATAEHCPNGHPWTPESTRYIKNGPDAGRRYCGTCQKAWNKLTRQRYRDQAAAIASGKGRMCRKDKHLLFGDALYCGECERIQDRKRYNQNKTPVCKPGYRAKILLGCGTVTYNPQPPMVSSGQPQDMYCPKHAKWERVESFKIEKRPEVIEELGVVPHLSAGGGRILAARRTQYETAIAKVPFGGVMGP